MTSRRIAVLALVALLLTGCGDAVAPTATAPAATPGDAVPTVVDATLGWLRDRTFDCVGPTVGTGGSRLWLCTLDMALGNDASNRTLYTVTLFATSAGLTELHAIVDQSRNPALNVDFAKGFLADTIAGSPATGDAGARLVPWVETNLQTGGAATIGSIRLTLSPYRPISEIDLAFVPG